MTRRRTRRSHVAALLATLLAGAAAAAGCNFVVGVGNYSIGDAAIEQDDGAAQGDVQGSDGGAAQDALVDQGTADRRGASDAPSDEGLVLDGTLDASHDGGGEDTGVADARPDAADAEADATPECGQAIPVGRPAFTSLVKACVAATSCNPYILFDTLSDCITNDTLASTGDGGALSCMSTMASCDDYYACEGVRYASLNECPSYTSACVGDVAFDCSGGATGGVPFPGTVTNCALTGATCMLYTDANQNSRAGCIVVPSCAPSSTWQCAGGNNIYMCNALEGGGGIGDGRSCGTATCVTTPNGATCSSDSEVCESSGSLSCDGSSLACSSNTQSASYDCTQAGGTCDPGGPSCVSPGCSASTCTESCAGSTATVCVGGAPYNVDCTQYNYGSGPSDSYSQCTQVNGDVYCTP